MKTITDPVCKKCGTEIHYVVPQIQYHSIQQIELGEDGKIKNVDLNCITQSYDDGEPHFYCEDCDEELEMEDIVSKDEGPCPNWTSGVQCDCSYCQKQIHYGKG